jgi:hypothetical protein
LTRYLLQAFETQNCATVRSGEGHRVPLFERPGYEETSAFPWSCHRDCELGKNSRQNKSRILGSLLTTITGAPEGLLIQLLGHASSHAREEILESPSICDSIDTVSNVAQKSGTGDSSLRVRCWGGDIHSLTDYGRFRTNSIRDAAGGYSDGVRSGRL